MLLHAGKILTTLKFANRNKTLLRKQEKVIRKAMLIIFSRLREKHDLTALDTNDVRDYLILKLSTKEKEVFSCIFLDNKNRLIDYKEMFYGTINRCTIHPREVVREAIRLNAAAIIFAHNNPSGSADESESDKAITKKLQDALSLIDVRVLDHFVIGDQEVMSFADRGYL